jgi:nucleoside diphosphate kinase
MSITRLFEQEKAGFTVYSPDCTQSRLWGNLDHAIHQATGFQPIYRQWIQHDYNSIMHFYTAGNQPPPPYLSPEEGARKYDNIPPQDLKYGHLVGKLFLSGPSLLTIWHGNRTIETLLILKGKTHPSEASSDSIRGRFWCDNGVCNLLHVSDDYPEAQRELRVLNLWESLDAADGAPLPLITPIPAPNTYIAHSGISVACDVVNRLLISCQAMPLMFSLPLSGNAKETNRILTDIMHHTAHQFPDTLAAKFIVAYLGGDVISVSEMFKQIPVTLWEKFIIQCGTITRDKWKG